MLHTLNLSVLKFFFPSRCWHCDELDFHPLCPSCLSFFTPLPPSTDPLVTFEGQGPAKTLINALKSGKAPRLAAGIAGYMALQLLKSHLPMPDFIVPVPQSFYRSLQVGYNPAFLLAKHLSKALDRPVISPLKRSSHLLRQTQLPTPQRYRLSSSQFQWRYHPPLQGKTVLLVDDLIGTGATLKCCTRRLSEAFPFKIISIVAISQDCGGRSQFDV